MSERFHLSSINPNDAIGGGGCACSPSKVEDCKGPYAIFPATETDNNLSPHCVVSLGCARAIYKRARQKDQIHAAGEADQPNDEGTL